MRTMAAKKKVDEAAEVRKDMRALGVTVKNLAAQVEMLGDALDYERVRYYDFAKEMRNLLDEVAVRVYSGESDVLTELRTQVRALEEEKAILVGHLRKNGIDDYPMNVWEVEDEDQAQ